VPKLKDTPKLGFVECMFSRVDSRSHVEEENSKVAGRAGLNLGNDSTQTRERSPQDHGTPPLDRKSRGRREEQNFGSAGL